MQVYPDVPGQQVGVTATKTINTIFMRMFGIGSVEVSNDALAGFGIVPVDAVMSIDATGSMGANPPCNASDNNSGCPIWEAKNAATAFTNTLLPGANTLVGRALLPRLLQGLAGRRWEYELHREQRHRRPDGTALEM